MNQTFTDYNDSHIGYFNNQNKTECLDSPYDNLWNYMRVSSQVFFYLTLILGVPGNAFVVYVAGMKMKRTVNTVGFLNLAIADLFCCLSTLYFVAESFLEENGLNGSVFMCKIVPLIMHITMFASVFTLSLISLDRFTLVITPVWAKNHRSLLIAQLSSVAAWVLALILSLPFMMIKENSTDGISYCLQYEFEKEQMYRRLCIITFVFGFLIPLICITTCYGFIAHKLGRSHFNSGRAFRIMLAIIVAFFLCWLPYHIVHLIIIFDNDGETSSFLVALVVYPLAISLAYVNSCLNPILYVFMGKDFKSNVKLSLRHVFERAFSEEGTQVSRSTQTQQMHSV
ncbi:C3a anaphylatoxin chemotactic receptor-like [Ctenopharyngodon idella]|uniref:C3a anaphylatoxin chemotactic receptor-like n=1 Tax=Ctenopharyngodon idella TaxID=7959 RepID=UPI00222F31A6|nr:C3a anaphylatoxin chemotactic receptor-like [Ctenopharyngodon idella]